MYSEKTQPRNYCPWNYSLTCYNLFDISYFSKQNFSGSKTENYNKVNDVTHGTSSEFTYQNETRVHSQYRWVNLQFNIRIEIQIALIAKSQNNFRFMLTFASRIANNEFFALKIRFLSIQTDVVLSIFIVPVAVHWVMLMSVLWLSVNLFRWMIGCLNCHPKKRICEILARHVN